MPHYTLHPPMIWAGKFGYSGEGESSAVIFTIVATIDIVVNRFILNILRTWNIVWGCGINDWYLCFLLMKLHWMGFF